MKIEVKEKDGEFFIEIPKNYLKKLKWAENDTLVLTLVDGRIEIVKKEKQE